MSKVRRRSKGTVNDLIDVAALPHRQEFVLRLARALMAFGAPSHRIEAQLKAVARILGITAHFLHRELTGLDAPDLMRLESRLSFLCHLEPKVAPHLKSTSSRLQPSLRWENYISFISYIGRLCTMRLASRKPRDRYLDSSRILPFMACTSDVLLPSLHRLSFVPCLSAVHSLICGSADWAEQCLHSCSKR